MDGAYWIVFAVAALICAWLEGAKDADKPVFDWKMPVVALGGVGVLLIAGKQFLELDLRLVPVGALAASVLGLAIAVWRRDSVFGLLAAGALAAQTVGPPVSAASDVNGVAFNGLFMVWLLAGWVGACIAWGGNARGGVAFAGIAGLVAMADRWTPEWFGKIPHFAGSLLAMAIVAAAVVVLLIRKAKSGPGVLLAGGLGILLVAGAGFFIARWGGDDSTLPITIFAALAAVFATTWMAGGETSVRNHTSQMVLGGLIWMAIATLAYAQDRNFGLGVAGLAAVGGYALLGRIDLASMVGPLISLGFYRTFRAEFGDIVRAFDIAQHYAMVGLMIGAGLIVLLLGMPRLVNAASVKDWLRFGVLALMAAIAAVVGLGFFGVKGGVGFVVGLGIGVWIAGLTSRQSAFGMAPLIGLSGLVGLSYAKASESFDLARDAKMNVFIWASVGLVILTAVLVFALTDKTIETEGTDEAAELA